MKTLSGRVSYDTPQKERPALTKCVTKKRSSEGFYPGAKNNYKGSGSSKLGMVPTGFEPVFQFDGDFALLVMSFDNFHMSETGTTKTPRVNKDAG